MNPNDPKSRIVSMPAGVKAEGDFYTYGSRLLVNTNQGPHFFDAKRNAFRPVAPLAEVEAQPKKDAGHE